MDVFEQGKKVEEKVEATQETKVDSRTSPDQNVEEVAHELKMRPIRELLGVPHSYEDDKLEAVYKWADPTGKLEKEEILRKINNFMAKLGEPRMGETKLDQAYKFVRIYQSFKTMVEEV